MTHTIVAALQTILSASDSAEYLAAQDAGAALVGNEYDALCRLARSHEDPALRWEALQLVSLIHAADHREVLERAMQEDPDPAVQECAKVLVFRSVVRQGVVESGRLTGPALEAYVQDVRRQAASRLFAQQK